MIEQLDKLFRECYDVDFEVAGDPKDNILRSMLSYLAAMKILKAAPEDQKQAFLEGTQFLVRNMEMNFRNNFKPASLLEGEGGYRNNLRKSTATFESPDGTIFRHVQDYAAVELRIIKKVAKPSA